MDAVILGCKSKAFSVKKRLDWSFWLCPRFIWSQEISEQVPTVWNHIPPLS